MHTTIDGDPCNGIVADEGTACYNTATARCTDCGAIFNLWSVDMGPGVMSGHGSPHEGVTA